MEKVVKEKTKIGKFFSNIFGVLSEPDETDVEMKQQVDELEKIQKRIGQEEKDEILREKNSFEQEIKVKDVKTKEKQDKNLKRDKDSLER